MRFYLAFMFVCLSVAASLALIVHILERVTKTEHQPKFSYGQCFNKMGLREPWDLEVAGRVYSRGYTKYLVMYADEANRVTLAPKTSWEEDIREFDSKYQVVPCPEAWKRHTTEEKLEKGYQRNKDRYQKGPAR